MYFQSEIPSNRINTGTKEDPIIITVRAYEDNRQKSASAYRLASNREWNSRYDNGKTARKRRNQAKRA